MRDIRRVHRDKTGTRKAYILQQKCDLHNMDKFLENTALLEVTY